MPYLPYFMARRYLFARKSHNVINIISAISAIGMAIGTAALVIILSVYNGFDSLVKSSLSNVEPDILVSLAKGKVFVPGDRLSEWTENNEAVESVSEILEDHVYIIYEGRNGVATARGVDAVYEQGTTIRDHIVDGEFRLHQGDVMLASVGQGLAYKMGINPHFLGGMELYFPDREKQFSTANPAASLNMVKIWPGSLFGINTDIDNNLMIIPIEGMRELLGYTDEVSGIEIRVREGTRPGQLKRMIADLRKTLGDDYKVLDRYRQNESLYKMMRYEKVSVWLILVFVIIIIAFNIFSSLSMLIIEKEGDIETLRSMGGTERLTKRIFILEGWMISLLGMLAGLVAGVIIVLIQQQFGIVKMPSGFVQTAYPVILKWEDILLTAVSVAAIGYLIALLPVRTLSESQKKRKNQALTQQS